MPHMVMNHEIDPIAAILDKIGDISEIELFNNQVLVAVYIRPEKTASGLYLSDKTRDEDQHQSKVGLVLKMGDRAFDDVYREKYTDVTIRKDDWIFFRASDGWATTVNKVLCRIVEDVDVKGRIPHPDQVW